MFPLHYTTRRFFCRVAFVLLCVAPTAGVLVWAGWVGTSLHVEACRREIEDQFQVVAKLADVSHPQPGVTIYEGLELFDPHSRQRLIYLPRLEAAARSGQLVLIATGPEVEDRALAALQTLAEQAWRATPSSISVAAGSLIVRQAGREEQLRDVRARLTRTTAAEEFDCSFRQAAIDAPQPIRLRVVRQSAAPADNLIELDTGDASLPCSLVTPFVPRMAHFGQHATFQAALKLRLDQDGWHGDVQGAIARIDLARTIAANFPHRIEGAVDLHIKRARISHSRLVEAVGSVSGGPGLIGPSLRTAAAQALDLPASQLALQPDGLLEYEQLAFEFTLDSRGLSLFGRCAQAASGALLIDRRQLLLAQPRVQPQPPAALIRMLVAAGSEQIPATREAVWLLAVLPQSPAAGPK